MKEMAKQQSADDQTATVDPVAAKVEATKKAISERKAKMRAAIEKAGAASVLLYLEWAEEKIRSFLRYRNEGKAHEVSFGSSGGGKRFDDMTVDDVVVSGLGLGYDVNYKDYLDVQTWIEEFVKIRPECKRLAELLNHEVYKGMAVEDFQVPTDFCGTKRQLKSLGHVSVHGAKTALQQFRSYVAREIERSL
jgi:hypothetical protein